MREPGRHDGQAMGYRVLVIDADPQASASNLLGVETASYDTNITHIDISNSSRRQTRSRMLTCQRPSSISTRADFSI